MDATRFAIRGAFDLIGSFDVLEHVQDDERAIVEMRNALNPGGGIIIAVPQHPWLWSAEDEFGHHVRRYRRRELEDKLERGGFAVLFSSSFVSLLLPLMVASRMLAKLRGAKPESETAVSPALNRALTAVLRAEIALTLKGVRWPLGGSRVVVARRTD
jgi:SAM-dependent methyltransferase